MNPSPVNSDQGGSALRQVADELRNIRRSVDWNAPPPRSLYAALRGSEAVARRALGEPAPDDFCHRGKYTSLASDEDRHGG